MDRCHARPREPTIASNRVGKTTPAEAFADVIGPKLTTPPGLVAENALSNPKLNLRFWTSLYLLHANHHGSQSACSVSPIKSLAQDADYRPL